MNRMRRMAKSVKGQAMVEFALVAPLLMMLVIGVFEFGRAWNVYQVITEAARAGARAAVVADASVTQDSVIATIRHDLTRAGLNPSGLNVSVTGWRAGTGTPASVSIQYPYRFVFLRPFMGWTSDEAAITLKTAFTMRNE
ncbi:MAG TPA: TadE family protein [Gemmatimonadales bacterium]|nr:TadE family protein [Gemmatimonadales bacterium]